MNLYKRILSAPLLISIIYGLYGFSTPDDFGMTELILGCLLVYFSLSRFRLQKDTKAVGIFFIFLLVYPLLIAFIFQNPSGDIGRDVIPLLFLFFGVLITPNKISELDFGSCKTGVLVIGIFFSLRHLLTIVERLDEIGYRSVYEGNDYFIMEPAVLFSALYLTLKASQSYFKSEYTKALLYTIASSIPIVGILSILLRGQIGLIVIANTLYALINTKSNQARKILLISAGFITIWLIVDLFDLNLLTNIGDALAMKTLESGFLNQRDSEFLDVFRLFASDFTLLITGTGWGGFIDTVASGGPVRYTHNAFLYFLLKGGLFGLTAGTWLFLYIYKSSKVEMARFVQPTFVSSLLTSIFNFVLEPGFKMLSLGFIIIVLMNSKWYDSNS
jgi:hypothetical protein